MQRRDAIKSLAMISGAAALGIAQEQEKPRFELATFSCDVTPPLGHPLIAGWREPAKTIKDRLLAKGLVLRGGEKPIVIMALDWCELRNDAYDHWREALAKAAGTTRERVLLACVHQHDAPYADLTAQKLLDEHGSPGSMFDPEFYKACVSGTAEALKKSLESPQSVTHVGVGQAKVERIACNRRVRLPPDRPRFNRYSSARDPKIRFAADGEIDPLLKTISFYDGDTPLAAVSCYSVHPMSYYGRGEVSCDFPGLARELRQREQPDVFQIYLSGCSGDTVGAKYNDGGEAGREALTRQLLDGLVRAWKATRIEPLAQVGFQNVAVHMKPETEGDLAPETLQKTLADENASHQARSTAALGLSWQLRCASGQPIDLPAIDFGVARLLLLPAEAFVGFQLATQKMAGETPVLAAGYGECAPGYIPTAATREEGFVDEHGYCWVAAGAENQLLQAIEQAVHDDE